MTPDALDQYFRIAESTVREALIRFVKAIQGLDKSWYLRKPTREDILQQMQINERWGWPGMFVCTINGRTVQWLSKGITKTKIIIGALFWRR